MGNLDIAKIIKVAVKLLEEQEQVHIEYQIIEKEEQKAEATA